MRSNFALALLCLLLGAALADWLSARDANAQALPPSSGGTSYTHPSAISLSNGIDSQDGGTFAGPVTMTGSGVATNLSVQGGISATTDGGFAALAVGGVSQSVGYPLIIWGPSRPGVKFIQSASGPSGAGCTLDGNGSTVEINCGFLAYGNIYASNGALQAQTYLHPNVAGGAGKPACSSGERNKIWFVQGGAGVADTIEVCAKSSADTYAWRSMATIP